MKNEKDITRGSDRLDPTFGNNGVYAVPHPEVAGRFLFPNMIVTEQNVSGLLEKIYATCDESGAGDGNKYLVRLLENGQLDTEFGKAGYCTFRDADAEGEYFWPEQLVVENGKLTGFGVILTGRYMFPAAFRTTQEGSLDVSFGNEGFIIYPVPVPLIRHVVTKRASNKPDVERPTERVRNELSQGRKLKSASLTSLADGKMLFLAFLDDYLQDFVCSYLARINADGSLDVSFGNEGTVTILDGDGTSAAPLYTTAAAIDAQGKISVVGTLGTQGVVVRFDAEGRLDRSFGEGGRLNITIAGKTCIPLDVIASDRKLIILCALAGTPLPQSAAALIQLLPDGRRDPEFNDGEPAIAEISPPYYYVSNGITIDQARRIIIAGARFLLEDHLFYTTGIMSRFRPQGVVDETFGLNGHSVQERLSTLRSVNVQGNEKIVTLTQDLTDDAKFVIARFIG